MCAQIAGRAACWRVTTRAPTNSGCSIRTPAIARKDAIRTRRSNVLTGKGRASSLGPSGRGQSGGTVDRIAGCRQSPGGLRNGGDAATCCGKRQDPRKCAQKPRISSMRSSSRSGCGGGIFDVDAATQRLAELNKAAEDPNLWNDPLKAQKAMRERDALEDQLKALARIEQELEDNLMLIELGEAEGDSAPVADAEIAFFF